MYQLTKTHHVNRSYTNSNRYCLYVSFQNTHEQKSTLWRPEVLARLKLRTWRFCTQSAYTPESNRKAGTPLLVKKKCDVLNFNVTVSSNFIRNIVWGNFICNNTSIAWTLGYKTRWNCTRERTVPIMSADRHITQNRSIWRFIHH